MSLIFLDFFFSSRRRHTRFDCDWSSDVCSSDLNAHPGADYVMNQAHPWYVGGRIEGVQMPSHYDFRSLRMTPEIGRASCRERCRSRGSAWLANNKEDIVSRYTTHRKDYYLHYCH